MILKGNKQIHELDLITPNPLNAKNYAVFFKLGSTHLQLMRDVHSIMLKCEKKRPFCHLITALN